MEAPIARKKPKRKTMKTITSLRERVTTLKDALKRYETILDDVDGSGSAVVLMH